MSARVSYKKQVVVISMLVFSFLAVLEIDEHLVSNDFDVFLDESSNSLTKIISSYKTPRIIPLIF